MPNHDVQAKKKKPWSSDEDQKVTELRKQGMKWNMIAEQLPGRSSLSCRLRFQNYIEPSEHDEWDEDSLNDLAILYRR